MYGLRATLCGVLMTAFGVAATAQNAGVVTAGADLDEDGGHRLSLGLNWSPWEATIFTLLGGRSELSTDFGDFTSTNVLLGFDHSFGKVGLTGQAHWWDQADLLSSRTFGGSVYFKGDAWRLDLRGESRRSDFDAFDFSTVIPVRTLTGFTFVPLSGRADCSLNNTGYGASISHSRGTWSFIAGGTAYDYSDNNCKVSNVVLPPDLTQLVISRDIFERIAARVLDATGQFIGSQLTRDNGFLASSLTFGLQYQWGERTLGLDYFHDREEFVGLDSNTLMGSFGFPVGSRTDLELRLGATDGDFTGTTAFAGAMFYIYFGGG